MLGRTVDLPNGFRDAHKEIIRRQRAASGRRKNTSRKLALAVAPCHLAARKSCSFLTSFVLSIRLLLCSRIADRWQMEWRRSGAIRSTGYNCPATDWLLPSGLLCKPCRPLVSPRPTSLHPGTSVTTINSKNRSGDYTPSRFASHCAIACAL